MTKQELIGQIRKKKSFLCIGLDPDMTKIPKHLLDKDDPIFEFNKEIIDSTHEFCVAYKPNTAFYEAYGVKGWQSLEKTINYIPKDCFVIADAKRGDIGNTSSFYAKTFFETLPCDAVTVAPYMGSDSVKPFLEFENKWVILLALTSNTGAYDFQFKEVENRKLYAEVIEKAKQWGSSEELMFVVGATRAVEIAEVRKIAPDYFFLVPGVGAQGGSLEEVVKYGSNNQCGLLVNSSRGIIYAGNEEDFATAAKKEALKIQSEMALYVQRYEW
jgi:orotidine-5'-phosphate decarboxylase